MVIYSRWIGLFILVVLATIIATRKEPWSRKIKYVIPFIEGMIGGLVVDSIGVNAGYYYFPRQPLYSLEYFGIVVPCWGVFGLFVHCLWEWVGKDKIWRCILVTILPLFAFYEGSNLITHSWVYTVDFYIVALGWMPLVLVAAGCNRRRRVVHKIDAMIIKLDRSVSWQNGLVVGLVFVRAIMTIVMFPLLFSYLSEYIMRYAQMRKHSIGAGSYLREMLLMR